MNYLRVLSVICLGVVLDISILGPQNVYAKLEEKFSWTQLKFAWPNAEVEQEAIKTGRYKPENNLPLGVERWQNKLFITVPRWKSGIAASLNYVDLNTMEKSPILQPYPNWEANTLPIEVIPANESSNNPMRGRLDAEKATNVHAELIDNATIISTFRLHVDVCDRLWVLDTGLADILGDPKQITPSAVVVFDLRTDTLLRRFPIPAEHVKEDTFFANIIVDVEPEQCDNAYAYIPDLGAYAVVVYSLRRNHAYRVKHNFFHFDPLNGDFNVGGVNFQWTDGVFGMAVGPKNADQSRDIYFHALASTKEFKVNNRILQNETHVTGSDAYFDFHLIGERGMNGQSTAEVYDPKTNVIFYTQVNKDAISCWRLNKPYTPETQGLVDSDSHTLVFPNDLKVDAEGNVWVLSDKMPVYLFKGLDNNAVNYRVLTGKNHELIKGTNCEV